LADGPPARRSGLLLAIAVGLCAALALGGGWMVWSGYRKVSGTFDCAQLGPEECGMEQDIAFAWARHQVGTGLILAALGSAMGLALWLTERRRAARKD